MQTFSGPLGVNNARLLLRRTTFVSSPSRVKRFALMTAEEAVDELIEYQSVTFDHANKGKSRGMVFDQYLTDEGFGPKFIDFLATMVPADIDGANSGMEAGWMSLLSHGVNMPYDQFIRHVIRDIVVGIFLGIQNNEYDPTGLRPAQENFARELVELFTLGLGRYDERDVRAIAKVLTGFRNTGQFDNPDTWTPELGWQQLGLSVKHHDWSEKSFSKHFDNYVIAANDKKKKRGEDVLAERDELVNIIFTHPEMGYRVIEKLHRHYVNRDPYIEGTEVVDELVQTFREAGWDFKPVLRKLWTSTYFYQDNFVWDRFSSPIEMLGLVNSYIGIDLDNMDRSKWIRRNGVLDAAGMPFLYSREVAGHSPQHEHGYDRLWMQEDVIRVRFNEFQKIANASQLQYLTQLNSLDEVFDELAEIVMPYGIDQTMKSNLLAEIEGEYHWTNQTEMRSDMVLQIAKYIVQSAQWQLL